MHTNNLTFSVQLELSYSTCRDCMLSKFCWEPSVTQPNSNMYLNTLQFTEFWPLSVQCTTVIMTVWTESLWAFLESYTAIHRQIVCLSNGRQQGRKKRAYSNDSVDRIFIGLSASSLIYPDRLFLHPPDRAQASFKGCWWLAYGSLQLMHVMWQPCCSSRTSNGGLKEDKSYYIAHNLGHQCDVWHVGLS